jgi:hypothetical protein
MAPLRELAPTCQSGACTCLPVRGFHLLARDRFQVLLACHRVRDRCCLSAVSIRTPTSDAGPFGGLPSLETKAAGLSSEPSLREASHNQAPIRSEQRIHNLSRDFNAIRE